jgi:hypothetical protein
MFAGHQPLHLFMDEGTACELDIDESDKDSD